MVPRTRSVPLRSTATFSLAAVLALLVLAATLGGSVGPAAGARPAADVSVTPLGLSRDAGLAKPPKPVVLVSPKPQKNANFGYSVAISGATAVVGAAEATVKSVDAGRAFIFNTANGSAINLTSPNSQAQSQGYFGYSVAVSGSTVAVGAPYESVKTGMGSDTYAGHVYLFSATTGKLTRTLKAPITQDDQVFGTSVAIHGTTLVVGMPGTSSGGEALVFNSKTGSLISTLDNPNAPNTSEFGEVVAINGSTVVVGAPYVDVSGVVEAGSAYTFSASTGTLIGSFVSPTPQTGGNFGASVAISATRVVVGAPGETDSQGYVAGFAYTFGLTSGKLISTLSNPIQSAGGKFGISVGINATTVVVGAWDETEKGVFESGGAFTFKAVNGKLASTLRSTHSFSGGGFGWSTAISGHSIVVGAPYETSKGRVGAGNVYLFG